VAAAGAGAARSLAVVPQLARVRTRAATKAANHPNRLIDISSGDRSSST
jgi:hypothetical protein